MGELAFFYVGFLFMLMLNIPNLLWAKYLPKENEANQEYKILLWMERIGQVLVTTCALVFSDFNIPSISSHSIVLFVSFLFMLLYEGYWTRYLRSEQTLKDIYCSFCGIPLAGATLPIVALFLLGLYGGVVWMLISVVIFGIGHIGIHLQHILEVDK